jgi:hypothetical protein
MYSCKLRDPGLAVISDASFRLFAAWSQRNKRAKHERSKHDTGVTLASWS